MGKKPVQNLIIHKVVKKANRADLVARLREERLESTRCSWERQFNESRKAFEAFVVYRDMGHARSQVKVARELGKSAQLIARWSAKWSWVSRIEEWIDEQDRENRLSQENAIKEMNERQATAGSLMLTRVYQALQGMSESDIAKFNPNQLARLSEASVKLERPARGEPTEILKSDVSIDSDLSRFETHDLLELEKILLRAAKTTESQTY